MKNKIKNERQSHVNKSCIINNFQKKKTKQGNGKWHMVEKKSWVELGRLWALNMYRLLKSPHAF